MRQRIYTSLEEGTVYGHAPLPEPAPCFIPKKARAPRRFHKARKHACVGACVVLCVVSARLLTAYLASDTTSPCSTTAHGLSSVYLPKWGSIFFPRAVSVGNTMLWFPRVLSREGTLKSIEATRGCPNVTVLRSSKIVVGAKSGALFGRRQNITLTGVTAACVQHAIDVLDRGCP